MGFKTYKLKDCLHTVIDNRGKSPKSHLKKIDGGFPLIEVNAIATESPFIEFSKVKKYVDNNTYETWFRNGHPIKNDILISTVGSIGEVCLMENEKVGIAQNIVALRADTHILHPVYLFYLLSNIETKALLKSLNISSVQPSLKVPHLLNIEIEVPSMIKQTKVIQILFKIDRKIKLNNEVIESLEQLAQTLFKHWFVDFEFPNVNGEPYKSSGGEMVESELGPIPLAWAVIGLGDLSIQVSKGTTPSKKDFDGTTDNKDIEFLKVKDINNDGLINFTTVEKIPKVIHLGRLKRSVLEAKDILLSIAGTIGRLSYIDSIRNGININQAIAFIRLKDIEKHFVFIYSYLKTDEFQNDIKSKVVQGVQANVSLSVIKSSLLIMPSNEVLDLYNKIVSPIIEEIESVRTENEKLVSLRDTVLPKLLSGEIEIPDEAEVIENVPIS